MKLFEYYVIQILETSFFFFVSVKELATKINPCNEYLKYNIHVCSKNNFPTACGLASSAAGYACFGKNIKNIFFCQIFIFFYIYFLSVYIGKFIWNR